jgi:hypothetical protein
VVLAEKEKTMRRLALEFLAAALWLGSVAQAQSRMGSQCAGNSARSSSAMTMSSSPGLSAFNGNGGTMTNGSMFGGSSLMMGGGFGSNLNVAAANALTQGGDGLGGFNNGFGMDAMYGLAAMNNNNTFGKIADDQDASSMSATRASNVRTPKMTRARSKVTKSKLKSKAKTAKIKSR